MPTKTYYLDADKTEVLTAEWGRSYKNFEIQYNGQLLGTVPDNNTLKQGYEFILPDGRSLVAQLTGSLYQRELELRLGGQPVPGSAAHPLERIKQAWYAILFIGGLNLVLGLLAVLQLAEFLQKLGVGSANVVEGIIYLSLGWWGYKRLSAVAFGIAGGLFILDSILVISASLSAANNPGVGALFTRFFLALVIYRGFQAARHLRTTGQVAVSES